MFDFHSYFAIVKSVAQETAKAIHKPSLDNKQAMTAYAKAVGATGKKASFTIEHQTRMLDYVV